MFKSSDIDVSAIGCSQAAISAPGYQDESANILLYQLLLIEAFPDVTLVD